MPELTKPEVATVDHLERALHVIQEVTSHQVTIGMLRAFVLVASHPLLTVVDVAHRLGQSKSTTSRQLRDLAAEYRDKSEGFRLLEPQTDPLDGRLVRYRCTPKGKTLAKRIAKELEAKWAP